jgi:uncharacterized spore protein YtfJ
LSSLIETTKEKIMEHVKELLESLDKALSKLARRNAVLTKPVSVQGHHLITLCELTLGFGGGGGKGEGDVETPKGKGFAAGTGGGAGGGAKAAPVAVLVVNGKQVRLQQLNG